MQVVRVRSPLVQRDASHPRHQHGEDMTLQSHPWQQRGAALPPFGRCRRHYRLLAPRHGQLLAAALMKQLHEQRHQVLCDWLLGPGLRVSVAGSLGTVGSTAIKTMVIGPTVPKEPTTETPTPQEPAAQALMTPSQ